MDEFAKNIATDEALVINLSGFIGGKGSRFRCGPFLLTAHMALQMYDFPYTLYLHVNPTQPGTNYPQWQLQE
ncbi:hypothetical protein GCM10028807_51800 [Spirosoma daeguense]